MSWPLSQDYNEAIQSPAANFADGDLKKGEAVSNALGLPIPFSGNFADVYQVRCPDGLRWAVKCFTREVPGLRERYQKISAHLDQAKLPFMVDFSYLEQGIRVVGKWHPVLKMQWVEGLTLNQFVGKHLDKPAMLEALAQIWTRMATRLRAAEVAHGDLQHGNILLVPGAGANSLALKLIDYDGMWTPSLAKNKSGEVGHGNYQHPQRLREGTYSLEVDRFPLLLVATALHALKVGGETLWRKFDNADNLLFKEADLLKPPMSPLFYELTKSNDPVVRRMLDHLLTALKGNLEATPFLEEVMPDAKREAPSPARHSKLGGPPSGTALNKSAPQVAPVVVAPVVAPPQTEKTFAFDEVAQERATSSPARRHRQAKTAMAGLGGVPTKARMGAAVAAVAVTGLIGILTAWAMSGSSTPQTAAPARTAALPTPPKQGETDAVLVLQIDQAGVDVTVDGEKQTVDVSGDGKPVTLRLKPGAHKVSVGKDGFKTLVEDFQLTAGQRPPVSVRLIRNAVGEQDPPGEPDAPVTVNQSKLYLYDLKEFECIVLGGHFRPGIDVNGVIVKGEKFKKGLGTHPLPKRYASAKYRLDGLDAFVFEGTVAINDTASHGSATPLTFQVLGDDKVLWTSKPVRAPRQTEDFRVKVEGVDVLELRVYCPGNISWAHAVWLDPHLLCRL